MPLPSELLSTTLEQLKAGTDMRGPLADLGRLLDYLLTRNDRTGNAAVTVVNTQPLKVPRAIIRYSRAESDLLFYSPDAVGLAQAISEAQDGDSIWLPTSTAIVMPSALSLPAGVSLVGLDSAKLLFYAFAGTALTMANRSLLANLDFAFYPSAGGSIGIDARAYSCIVSPRSIYIDGEYAGNIGVLIGSNA